MSEWISVDERLPINDQNVLVLFKRYADHDILCAQFTVFNNRFTSRGYYGAPIMNVTHWMPLPEPPSND